MKVPKEVTKMIYKIRGKFIAMECKIKGCIYGGCRGL